MDVSKVNLTKKEQKIFDKFGDDGTAELTLSEFEVLRPTKLIQDRLGGSLPGSSTRPTSGKCWLSGEGDEYRRYHLARLAVERRNTRRYWITTGIAAAALIKSFWPEISSALAWLLTLSGQ